MKKIILLIVTFYLAMSQAGYGAVSRAGTETGNGGDVIVCQNPQSEHHLKMLDVYEAERYGMPPKWGKGKDWKELAREQLLRWTEIAPLRMEEYLSWLDTFESETNFTDNITIPDIPDHGSVVLPSGCRPEQVALQRHDNIIFPGVKRYEIDNQYWKNMSSEQRAALVIHEIVYREAIKVGHTNSIPTRYFAGFLMGAELDPLQYFRVVIQLPFEYVEFFSSVAQNGKYKCRSFSYCDWWGRIQLNDGGWPKKIWLNLIPSSTKITIPHLSCNRGKKGEGMGVAFTDKGVISEVEKGGCWPGIGNFYEFINQNDGRFWRVTSDPEGYFNFSPYLDGAKIWGKQVKMSSSGVELYFDSLKEIKFIKLKKIGLVKVANYPPPWVQQKTKFFPGYSKDSYIEIDGKRFSSIELMVLNEPRGEIIESFKANGVWWIFDEAKDKWVESPE